MSRIRFLHGPARYGVATFQLSEEELLEDSARALPFAKA
jgi:hypothetical protein